MADRREPSSHPRSTIDWRTLVDLRSRARDVVLVTGALPLLAGLPVSLIDHGRRTLRAIGVSLLQGVNVARVEPRPVHLEDEIVLAGDLAVCAEASKTRRSYRVSPFLTGSKTAFPSTQRSKHPSTPGSSRSGTWRSSRSRAPGARSGHRPGRSRRGPHGRGERSRPLEGCIAYPLLVAGTRGDRLPRPRPRSRVLAPCFVVGSPRVLPQASGPVGVREGGSNGRAFPSTLVDPQGRYRGDRSPYHPA